ncbi:hypothetical protein [Mycoplasma sp. Ms02]|uniref:hypothetical protein n=1 Tax=Mycoplasma sp. Ms02 TaxID=353851 RepID=UPI001C8AFB4E|nr:hypothetical protein [Mycoplasma sp. Ms02]QZE12441.1 hypothetical protein K4L35_00400 [Mycoplasma sp. Ms02]
MKKSILKSKFWLYLALGAASVGALGSAVYFKIKNNYKPNFWNYKSYISASNLTKLSETMDYKVFSGINEFTTAIVNNKAVAGIGSDFQAASLIKKGYLQPINFQKFLDLPETTTEDELKSLLEKLYTETVWNHLESYDEYLKTDWEGNEINDHLWKYFVPYFAQDAVFGYNKASNKNKEIEITTELLEQNLAKIQNVEGISDPYSQFNIINTMKNNGFNRFFFTDAMRDNLIYGSTYRTKLNGTRKVVDSSEFTGDVKEETYGSLIDNFKNLVLDAMGKSITDTSAVNAIADGQELLNKTIDPDRNDARFSIMYNGDALDAYNSEDNFGKIATEEYDEDDEEAPARVPVGTLGVVKPTQNLLLVDGFIVVKNLEENTENLIYETVRGTFYNSFFDHAKLIRESNYDQELAYKTYAKNIYADFLPYMLDSMLEKVKKVTDEERQKLHDWLLETYNVKWYQDLEARKAQLDANPEVKEILKKVFKWYFLIKEKKYPEVYNVLYQLSYINIDDYVDEDELFEKYGNLSNFAFVNYTPANFFDYTLMLDNYFLDATTGEVDEDARNIYIISNENVYSGKPAVHTRISPISDELMSKVQEYYYRNTKN